MLIISLIQCLILSANFVASWDIAVLMKDEINFFEKNKSIGTVSGRLKKLLSGTYDPVNGDIYVSDNNQANASIFRVNVFRSFEDTSAIVFQPIVSKQSSVFGMTFEPVTSSLFWTTGREHTIMKLVVNQTDKISLPNPGSVLHEFKYQIPYGIAVDSCQQMLYWTNIRHPNVTIERSKIDGTQYEVIVMDDIYQPYGIEIDQKNQKIYWCDVIETGSMYRIERSNLDGSNRENVISGEDQYPYALSFVGDYIYWTDGRHSNLLSVPKNSVENMKPEVIQKYGDGLDGIISNELYSDIDPEKCKSLAPLIKQITANNLKEINILSNQYSNIFQTNHSNSKLVCLNNGQQKNGICECTGLYTGVHCEISSCHNYCFSGVCELNSDGKPICKCNKGQSGIRCEIDQCQGVCMNNGKCLVDEYNKTVCTCDYGYIGPRCEFQSVMLKELCKPYCLYNSQMALHYQSSNTVEEINKNLLLLNSLQLCQCSEIMPDMINEASLNANNEPHNIITARINTAIICSLGVLCLLLGLIVVYLSTKITKLNIRPRIRKRIVINKLPPFKCRPQSPREQCEITIENCCNMNICETPCFESDLKSGKATFKKIKTEDKRNLISSMYSNSSSQEEENY